VVTGTYWLQQTVINDPHTITAKFLNCIKFRVHQFYQFLILKPISRYTPSIPRQCFCCTAYL